MMDAAGEKRVQIEDSWYKALEAEFPKPYFEQLRNFLKAEKAAGKTIFPAGADIFNAFAHAPFGKIKAVILGQDPYHGPRQAHGLSFSVQPGVDVPPSLRNIFLELESDLGLKAGRSGDLRTWAGQGLLLLNTVLTVENGMPRSHAGKGWEQFTTAAIEALNRDRENLVFILWGSDAQSKAALLDHKKHLVIQAPHPSPLSAYRGFLGSKPFSKTNDYLISNGIAPIDWDLY